MGQNRQYLFNMSYLEVFGVLTAGMWKQKLEAEELEEVLFLWKRKRKNPTSSASTQVI